MSLKGRLELRLADTGLKVLRKERSCRFHRAYGDGRYSCLSISALTSSKLPRYLKSQQLSIRRSYQEWLRNEKRFLGCTWASLLVGEKSRKPRCLQDRDDSGGQRDVLFAIQTDHSTIPINEAVPTDSVKHWPPTMRA